jgi:hypothetical protein
LKINILKIKKKLNCFLRENKRKEVRNLNNLKLILHNNQKLNSNSSNLFNWKR